MAAFDTIIGVILAIVAGLMFTVGAVFQKQAVEDMPEIKLSDMSSMTAMLKNRTWVIGVLAGILGGIPYVISQSYIGLGYTQLLIATGLILLAYMASRTLKEPLGIMEYSGITLIILGTVFLGLAQLKDVAVTPSEPNFLINVFIFFTPFWVATVAGLIFYKFSDWGAAKIIGALSGIVFGVGAGFSQIGVLGIEEGNVLVLIIGYFILIAGTVIGTVLANIAFQKGKAIIVIPIQSAGNYLIPVFAGLMLFQQVFRFWYFFWPSVILIMVGVFLLARIQAEMEESSEASEDNTQNPSD